MSRTTPIVPAAVSALAPFVDAGVFGPAEVQLAAALTRLVPGRSDAEVLAVAVAARAPRLGHVGIELARVADRILEIDAADDTVLPWPDADRWIAALVDSPLVADPATHLDVPRRPLVWDGERIYLQRYFAYERAVADDLRARSAAAPPPAPTGLGAVLDRLFPPPADGSADLQRRAVEVALANRVSVIAGGPGTGKTRTIARLLAAAHTAASASGAPLQVAVAAPTGKASARMTDAVHQAVAETEADGAIDPAVAEVLRASEATTIHRLLRSWGGTRFGHDRFQPLPHDVVIVDETSMVALPLMARLLDALRPDARLVLVGDPDQLASVEAGTVLADLVGPDRLVDPGAAAEEAGAGPLAGRVTTLRRVHRFGADSGIAALADAVRVGDVERALGLLDGGHPDLTWIRPDRTDAVEAVQAELVASGVALVDAARAGDGAAALGLAGRIKVLAAVRRGPNGRHDWGRRVEQAVLDQVGDVGRRGAWYCGRPVLITHNDPLNRVFNGDTGVTVATSDGLAVALTDRRAPGGVRPVSPARLQDVEPWWSMTIHKSQGSEFPHVVVALPTVASPVLTRELLYTAVTRARQQVTVVATDDAVRTAIARPVARASGLAGLLWS